MHKNKRRIPVVRGSLMIAFSLVILYQIKDRVREVRRDIAQMETELVEEREAVHVLEAEWSYLTRPERLQYLMQQYGGMRVLTSERLVAYNQLPDTPVVPVPVLLKPVPTKEPAMQGAVSVSYTTSAKGNAW